MITISTLIFAAYATLEGIREAFYFHYKGFGNPETVPDEHLLFTLQRAIVWMILPFVAFPLYGWWCAITLVTTPLIFSFFHNGNYYSTRNTIDPTVYHKGFKDMTTSSTAKISMSYPVRTTLFVIGILGAVTADLFLIILY